jgi:hypothetical protein
MLFAHQLVIDCGLSDDFNCQLNQDSLEQIKVRTHSTPAQYNYYLLINNHLQESCRVVLQPQVINQKYVALWSKIYLKIFYQKLQLFNDNLSNFFSKKIDALTLEAKSSKLYRLEFHLAEFSEEFEIIFDLNFLLNCQEKSLKNQKNKPEVLATQSQNFQESTIEPLIGVQDNLFQEKSQLLFILITFLLILLIICLFWILKIKKFKNIN